MALEIKTPQDLYEIMLAAQGGNPKAQQILNNFMDFKDIIERSNLPDRKLARMMAFLKGNSKLFYKDADGNPFRIAYESAASALMALKSKKSDQFVEMTKQTPTLAELTTQGESEKPRLRDRIFGRRDKE